MTDTDSSVPLQHAVLNKLLSDAGVRAIVGAKVADISPAKATRPNITFGQFQVDPEDGDKYDGADISFQLDLWVEGPNTKGCKVLGAKVRAALHKAELTVDGHRLISLEITSALYLLDPDGQTMHGALTFRARTEPTT